MHIINVVSDVVLGNDKIIVGNVQHTGNTGGDEFLLDDVDDPVVLASADGSSSVWSGDGSFSANSLASTALSDFEITIVAAVPLPAALPLMFTGLTVLGAAATRRRHRR